MEWEMEENKIIDGALTKTDKNNARDFFIRYLKKK